MIKRSDVQRSLFSHPVGVPDPTLEPSRLSRILNRARELSGMATTKAVERSSIRPSSDSWSRLQESLDRHLLVQDTLGTQKSGFDAQLMSRDLASQR